MNALVTLDGTAVSLPDGIKDLAQTLTYEEEVYGIFNRIEGTFTFSNDGYEYLRDLLFGSGFCNSVILKLYVGTDSLSLYFDGIIHIPDFNELNISRKTIKTPVANNDASSYVYNNKDIKAYLNVTKSKNAVTISAATRITNFNLFTPSTGSYDYVSSWVYTVDEAFNYLIAFMSDGNMTYSSPYFGAGGEKENICIASGFGLRNTGATAAPFVSFFDLFTEMRKLYNISFYISYASGTPEMIIDRTENLYSTTPLITFNDVRDVILTIEQNKLYAKVVLGSDKTESDGSFTFPVVKFLGFLEEEYHVLGQCNTTNFLDLKNQYIIDSNVIEDILVNANDAYDEDIVILETDEPGTDQATQFNNLIPGGTFVYNLGLNNFNKSQNYLGSFPADMLLFLNNDANSFEATKNSYSIATGNILHATEISDPGGNYDNATGRFAAPIGGDGTYSFTFAYSGLALVGEAEGVNMGDVYFRHYDSGAVLIEEILVKTFFSEPITPANNFGSVSGSFYLSATDYVRVEGVATAGTITIGLSTFSGIFADEGGTYQAYDSNDYRILDVEFEVPTTQTQYETIRNNPTDMITVVTSDGQTLNGWIKNLKRNILTGMTQITLRTNANSNI